MKFMSSLIVLVAALVSGCSTVCHHTETLHTNLPRHSVVIRNQTDYQLTLVPGEVWQVKTVDGQAITSLHQLEIMPRRELILLNNPATQSRVVLIHFMVIHINPNPVGWEAKRLVGVSQKFAVDTDAVLPQVIAVKQGDVPRDRYR